jgi:dTMP kinase
MRRGKFISVEGGEGVGKSTQVALLAGSLADEGYEVLCVRDPGGTGIGEKIRAILLDKDNDELNARVELLLYLASRAQLVSQLIEPALTAGKVVITDRFHHSTLAYQAGARSIDMEMVREMNLFATAGILPDLTFLLDLPPDEGFSRKSSDNEENDRMEDQGQTFHEWVRRTFLKLAEQDPGRIRVIDARGAKEEIALEIRKQVVEMLERDKDRQ